jgi:hypothetical protein
MLLEMLPYWSSWLDVGAKLLFWACCQISWWMWGPHVKMPKVE